MSAPIGRDTPQRRASTASRKTEALARRPGNRARPHLHFKLFSVTQTVATGDKRDEFEIPQDMNGMILIAVESYVTTTSSSGKPTVQLRNVTSGQDMLSTKVEIDAGELNSKDAGTQPVINTAQDDVAWGDHIAFDVDVAGTGAKGLGLWLTFEHPRN